jgi:hydroxymethylbilane synthase
MHPRVLTIGSRGSALALWQANFIAGKLRDRGVPTRIQIIKTTGDRLQTVERHGDAAPSNFAVDVNASGKGLFTKEIEESLLAGEIDLAVHSLKDLPTELPSGLVLAAIPEREDPRDCICGSTLAALPPGARVGTSSPRRAAQVRVLRPDLTLEPVRGNVDTRLRKLREGQFGGILLAAAGLKRLGLEHEIAEVFSADQICPAPGQGALAIETRDSDEVQAICADLNHAPTAAAVSCERAVLAALGGGCLLPIGAYAEPAAGGLHLTAIVITPDGKRFVREYVDGPMAEPEQLGSSLATRLLNRGAAEILRGVGARP